MNILTRLSRIFNRLDRKKLWLIWAANMLWIVLLFSYPAFPEGQTDWD